MEPQIQYTKTSDGVNIAYYTVGSGPPLIWMSPSLVTNIEDEWNLPSIGRLIRASARFFTVVRYGPRGCGLSDRDVGEFSLSAMTNDLAAVVDRTAPESCGLFVGGWGAPVAVAYAATQPERVARLLIWSPVWGIPHKALDQVLALARTDWTMASESYLSAVDGWSNPEDAHAWAKMARRAVRPETMFRYSETTGTWDVSELAPRVRARTLVLHPRDHPYYSAEFARSLASAIPGASLAMTEGASALMPSPQALARMSEFWSDVSGVAMRQPAPGREATETSSGTAIILFADIADSTALTEDLGDRPFREKARNLDTALRAIIREHSGTSIDAKTLGDGVLATFTSAAKAVEAALACGRAGEEAGLPLHLGLHAGDVIREENNVYGGAVNVAARISGLSAPGEVLVSDTLRGLARTSAGVSFEDRGEHSLKGVGEPVRVFAVMQRG
jgi:class 3 adenylate cyclase